MNNEDVIVIPISGQDETVDIPVSELPEDVADMQNVLRAEIAPLDCWIKVARGYYSLGYKTNTLKILKVHEEDAFEQFYKDDVGGRVEIFNTLAAFQIAESEFVSGEQKTVLLHDTTKILNNADKLDQFVALTWVLKSLLKTAQGQKGNDFFLSVVFEQSPNYVPALMVQATEAFSKALKLRNADDKKDLIKQCLESLRTVLRVHHNCPACVRMGMGYCFFFLEQYNNAEKAFKRALALDPTNEECAAALGVLEIHKGRYKEATTHFFHAYGIRNDNPLALLGLADYYFHAWSELNGTVSGVKGQSHLTTSADFSNSLHPNTPVRINERIYMIAPGLASVTSNAIELQEPYRGETGVENRIQFKDFSKVLQFCENVLGAHNPSLRAEANFMMGRAHHASQDFKKAIAHYERSLYDRADHHLAKFCLAQVLLKDQNTRRKARHFFRELVEIYPNDSDLLEVMAMIAFEDGNLKDAEKKLRKVIEINPSNPLVQQTLAAILQKHDSKYSRANALECYNNAVRLYNMQNRAVPVGVWTNMGVLYRLNGDNENARKFTLLSLKEHLRAIDAENANSVFNDGDFTNIPRVIYEIMFNPECLTATFNLAVILESLGLFIESQNILLEMHKRHNNYTDAAVRYAQDLGKHGNVDKCVEFLTSLNKNSSTPDVDVLATLGSVYCESRKWVQGQKEFEEILKLETHRSDAYASLACGNIFFDTHRTAPGDKSQKYLKYAERYYNQVLARNPSNIYAANGVGMVLAESGFLKESQQVFQSIREAQPDFANVWINLAHITMATGNKEQGTVLYEQASKRFFKDKNVKVLQYVAMSQYELKHFEDAIKTMSKAFAVDPHDYRMWYNYALLLHDSAIDILKKKAETRTLQEVETAVARIEQAYNLFSDLSTDGALYAAADASGMKLPGEKARSRAEHCKKNKPQAKAHLDHAREVHKHQEEKRAETERRQQERIDSIRAAKEEALRKKQLEHEEKQEKARHQLEAYRKMQKAKELEVDEGEPAKKKAKKKTKKAANESISDEESSESDSDDLFGSDSEEEEEEQKEEKPSDDTVELDSEDDMLFGSDSEDEDNNNNNNNNVTSENVEEEGQTVILDDEDENELFGSESEDDETPMQIEPQPTEIEQPEQINEQPQEPQEQETPVEQEMIDEEQPQEVQEEQPSIQEEQPQPQPQQQEEEEMVVEENTVDAVEENSTMVDSQELIDGTQVNLDDVIEFEESMDVDVGDEVLPPIGNNEPHQVIEEQQQQEQQEEEEQQQPQEQQEEKKEASSETQETQEISGTLMEL